MRLYILILATILLQNTAQAQQSENRAMQKALAMWGQEQNNEACMLLERISKLNDKNWLAPYYIAFINISEALKNSTNKNIENNIITAEKNIQLAYSRQGDVSELLCLEGMKYTIELTIDPMNKGRELLPLIRGKYMKAIRVNNKNPRAHYLLAYFSIRSSKFTGADTKKYYSNLDKSIGLFDIFEKQEMFSPTWGKKSVEKILKNKND